MAISPNDSEQYTGPDTISPECQYYKEVILELSLTETEKLIIACRSYGDTWPVIAIRMRISRSAVIDSYKRACLKINQLVEAIQTKGNNGK